MKKMMSMLVLVFVIGVASTTLVGCSKDTKASGTTTKGDSSTGSTEKKETTEAKP